MRKFYKVWTLIAADILFRKTRKCKTQLNQEDRKCMVPKRLQVQETIRRYQQIDGYMSQIISKNLSSKELLTEKLDKVLVHPILGYLVFCLDFVDDFPKRFFIAEYPMNWIDGSFSWLSHFTKTHLPVISILYFQTE